MIRKSLKDNPSKGLSFLYNTTFGRLLLKPLVGNCFVSNLIGHIMNTKLSKILIKSFIKNYNINMNEYVDVKYNSFNDFFIRQVREGKRKIDDNKSNLISPCDSKLTCYKIDKDTLFNIKKSNYSVSSILNNNSLAQKFIGGYALVFRLSPDDYHHYCFVDSGNIINNYKIKGKFNTVNPIVYDKFKVFQENTRECTIISTNNFGEIVYVEVGALLVGKINNIITEGKFIKGQEKGYFMYGGSTVVILLKKNAVVIDDDIINNSKKGMETYVKYGEKIGKKTE